MPNASRTPARTLASPPPSAVVNGATANLSDRGQRLGNLRPQFAIAVAKILDSTQEWHPRLSAPCRRALWAAPSRKLVSSPLSDAINSGFRRVADLGEPRSTEKQRLCLAR
jgi:hypothetical protein